MQSATKAGMKPILTNGIEGFVEEPDIVLAETALAGNIKLVEGVSKTYDDDRGFLIMASMARANYAFGFVQDELEAARVAYPADDAKVRPLLVRLLDNFAVGRRYAERALAMNDDWSETIGTRKLEEVPPAELAELLERLDAEEAEPLFWLAFNWGGAVQANLDLGEATQLPKLEMIANRVLALDDTIFFGLGPHLMAAVFFGFRSQAMGGNPEAAREHFALATERSGGLLLPAVLEAQFVDGQSENQTHFEKSLAAVLAAPINPKRAVFDTLAKIKACRLLANIDTFFLADATPPPKVCHDFPHKHPLRESPLEEEEGDGTPVAAPEPESM